MIHNLALYNAHKRGTLDRVANRYTYQWMDAVGKHLEKIKSDFESAIKNDDSTFKVPSVQYVDKMFESVLDQHQDQAILVGVSDAIREVDPDTKLSTWMNYPVFFPVEQTFVSLKAKTMRDRIAERIKKSINKTQKTFLEELFSSSKSRYLEIIKQTFKVAVKGYYYKEKSKDTQESVNQALQKIYAITRSEAERMFRTETTRLFNDARVNYFKNDTGVDFLQIFAITDGRISNICESRHKYVMPVAYGSRKGFKPPFHPHCRTILSPLDTDLRSDRDEVMRYLGSEFGSVDLKNVDKKFKGKRPSPTVPLPRGWG